MTLYIDDKPAKIKDVCKAILMLSWADLELFAYEIEDMRSSHAESRKKVTAGTINGAANIFINRVD